MVVAFDQQSDFIDHQQSAPLVVVQEKFKCFINNTQQLNWKNILIPDHNMKSMDSFATKFVNNNDMNQKEMKNKILTTMTKQQQSMVADNNGKQFDNKPIKLDIDDSGDDKNNYNNNISDSKSGKQHSLLLDNAGVDEVDSVKKIIDSGWIQHSSTKKLLYYLRKIDEVLFKDAGLGGDATDVVDDLLSFEDVDDSFTPDKDEIMNNKPKNVDKVMENNKNFEIILNRMMNTPTVVKKRGEGPQLSIDYPLTVLRQRLMAELARRKAKETEEQIAINTEILKKLGRRRRRRRSISPITNHPISNHREQYTMAHRYPTLNKHQRFRNNNKYFAYDRLINDIGNSSTTNIKRQIRINSKKQSWPIINRLNNGGDKRIIKPSKHKYTGSLLKKTRNRPVGKTCCSSLSIAKHCQGSSSYRIIVSSLLL
ncbi:hypothetical protein HUG17_10509 [Dermatophagoides farinae]|uniref:Corticotropin-releasing factor domain-containing protein n=1 Tax=Dermatophagoides farinae TaxID=6954 RepID=A0A9D4NQA5_DERFA|nr:hypothetical protein HUG17_10509 [Dermatophagoides farinae]